MTINYTNTEPSKNYCRHFNCWCVMANGMGNCSQTACAYGYDRKTYSNKSESTPTISTNSHHVFKTIKAYAESVCESEDYPALCVDASDEGGDTE